MKSGNQNFSQDIGQSEDKASISEITIQIEQRRKDMGLVVDVVNSFEAISGKLPSGFFCSSRWNNLVHDFQDKIKKFKESYLDKFKKISSGCFNKSDLDNAKSDLGILLLAANSIISFDFKDYQLDMKTILDTYLNKVRDYNDSLVAENIKLKSAENLYTIQKHQSEKLKEKEAKQAETITQLQNDKKNLEEAKENLLTVTGVLVGSWRDMPLCMELILSRLNQSSGSPEELNLIHQQITTVVNTKQKQTQELVEQVLPPSSPRLFGPYKKPTKVNPGFSAEPNQGVGSNPAQSKAI